MKRRKPADPIVAAHEAGMHDRKPLAPGKCPICDMNASSQRAFGDLLDLRPRRGR